MSLAEQFDIGAKIFGVPAMRSVTILGSSAAATTQADGQAVDRQASGRRQYYSCKSLVSGSFTGSSSQQKVDVTIGFQHSDTSGSGFTDYSTASAPAALQIGTTSSGGTANTTGGEQSIAQQRVNLNGAKRWIRVTVTPAFGTSSSGESLATQAAIVFGGADELPAQ